MKNEWYWKQKILLILDGVQGSCAVKFGLNTGILEGVMRRQSVVLGSFHCQVHIGTFRINQLNESMVVGGQRKFYSEAKLGRVYRNIKQKEF